MKMNKEYTTNDLLTIFNDIAMISINNNLCLKDKVVKKMDLIKRLSDTNIEILNYNNQKKEGLFNYLNSITHKFTTLKKNYNQLNNKLNIILGNIIHNAYLTSGYQVLISNIPELAIQKINNSITIVDEESIYDTIDYYIKTTNGILSVVKIDTNTYLAKLKNINDARYLCSIIHDMQVETNIIRVEMLENLENCFNDEQIVLENNTSNNINNINTISNIDIINDNECCNDGYNTIDIKTESKSLLQTYYDLIYSKIYSILSYFWKK